MSLKLAADLKLPLDVVTQTMAILAKRRAGKSYTMRRLAEQLVKASQQVVVVDPKGDQWGIRSSADGKGPGLPLIIIGGERGDVPLEVGAGEVVAKLIVEERVSAVLDLSLFRKREVATFMQEFLENVYRLKAREIFRTPMMLVVDEADAIAPQKPMPGEERMLGAIEDIVRRGGQRGIGCVLVTQRSAVLNKNVLTQAQILVALRTIAPQDLKAMKEWIDVHGEEAERKVLMESLPSLPVGDAWFWSPGWPTNDGIFQRVHVLPIETFDSGATPKPGEKRHEPKMVAEVDLDALKRQMAATIEKAKADDPKELRKKIAELERQVRAAGAAQISRSTEKRQEQQPKVIEKPVLKDGQIDKVHHLSAMLAERAIKIFGPLQKIADQLTAASNDIAAAVALTRQPAAASTRVQPACRILDTIPARVRKLPDVIHTAERNGYLPPGEKATLIAAAQYPNGLTREQASILTGYKRSSRDAYIQRLIGRGYVIVAGGNIVATDVGVAALGSDYEPLPTGEALQAYWLNKLPPGEKAVLEAVIRKYPNDLDVELIDESTGYKRSSRDAYIQRLVARQLVSRERGTVRASEVLF